MREVNIVTLTARFVSERSMCVTKPISGSTPPKTWQRI